MFVGCLQDGVFQCTCVPFPGDLHFVSLGRKHWNAVSLPSSLPKWIVLGLGPILLLMRDPDVIQEQLRGEMTSCWGLFPAAISKSIRSCPPTSPAALTCHSAPFLLPVWALTSLGCPRSLPLLLLCMCWVTWFVNISHESSRGRDECVLISLRIQAWCLTSRLPGLCTRSGAGRQGPPGQATMVEVLVSWRSQPPSWPQELSGLCRERLVWGQTLVSFSRRCLECLPQLLLNLDAFPMSLW